jgi:hypothetical protein
MNTIGGPVTAYVNAALELGNPRGRLPSPSTAQSVRRLSIARIRPKTADQATFRTVIRCACLPSIIQPGGRAGRGKVRLLEAQADLPGLRAGSAMVGLGGGGWQPSARSEDG